MRNILYVASIQLEIGILKIVCARVTGIICIGANDCSGNRLNLHLLGEQVVTLLSSQVGGIQHSTPLLLASVRVSV